MSINMLVLPAMALLVMIGRSALSHYRSPPGPAPPLGDDKLDSRLQALSREGRLDLNHQEL